MPRFVFKKLVRDTIADDQIARGGHPDYRLLSKEEHIVELAKKIAEEANEIPGAPAAEYAEELADVQQAVDDLRNLLGVSRDEVAAAQTKKAAKKGGFSKGVYIESVEVAEGDDWIPHFRENPDRYPEIK